MAISTRQPEVTVEYDCRGKRTTKHFTDAHQAKRFYTTKERAGKRPKLVAPTKPRGTKHLAVYVRVSTKSQSHESQLPDLEQWAVNQDLPVHWYKDKASGKSMDRPGWKALEKQIHLGKVDTVCVWRMDRLGRTVSGLSKLFDLLGERKVNLVSLRDCLDLKTPAGRLLANVLASVAAYESEVKGERVRAGQSVAKKNGKTWGGKRHAKPWKVTPEVEKGILTMISDGVPVSRVANSFQLSRDTVYKVIRRDQEKQGNIVLGNQIDTRKLRG